MSKTLRTLISIVMNTTDSTGASSGTVTRRKTCHSVAPSVRAASSTSRGIAARPGADHDHREAGPHPDVGDDDRRRDQLRAEPRDAAERRRERRLADADLVAAAASRPLNVERAVVAGRRACHLLAGRVEQVDRARPGCRARPARPCRATPPPGLKSRQTTPSIVAVLRRGRDGLLRRRRGTSVGGIAVRPSSATLPGCDRRLAGRSPSAASRSASTSTAARSRARPAATNQARDRRRSPALTAPWLGSLMYMTCQITPVAKSEIAIGMNTTVLNATDQRMRSVSTAKMSPIAVTIAGHDQRSRSRCS